MAERYIPTASWVYDYYYNTSRHILDHTLAAQYEKWVENKDSITRRIAWAYIRGLVKVARDRGIFNEKTWEIEIDDE